MNIRSTIRVLTLAGAAAVIFPGTASAANPAFGSWSVGAGGVITGCPAGFTCTTLTAEDGFLQAQVTDGVQTFFQTVVTNEGLSSGNAGSLPFSTENFVEQVTGGAGDGILGKMVNNDPAGGLTSSATLQTGDFATAALNDINVTQIINDDNGTPANSNDNFLTTMVLDRDIDSGTGAAIGTNLAINQITGLDISGSQVFADRDRTIFDFSRKSGTHQTTAGTTTVPTGSGTSTTCGTGTDCTADWRVSEDIVAVWIGQRIELDTLGTQFAGYQGFQNLSTAQGGGAGTQFIDTFDFGGAAQAGPWDWGTGSDMEAAFGTAPGL